MTSNKTGLLVEEPQSKDCCLNCKTPLSGPFCYECGQPSKSIIRFFGSLLRELMDDVISLDSRAMRTFYALLFRPGFLTEEYIQGRRFKYVPPLRLFLFTSLFCIFLIWIVTKISPPELPDAVLAPAEVTENSPADFESLKNKVLENSKSELSDEEIALLTEKLEQAQLTINKHKTPQEDSSLAEKGETQDSEQAKQQEKSSQNGIVFENNKATFHFDFLDESTNIRLTKQLNESIEKAKNNPSDFIDDILELIPKSTLFLVPIFALFLKLLYLFSRRYYIEHLIHAFHGHSFLFLIISVSILLENLSIYLSMSSIGAISALGGLLSIIDAFLIWWVPVYFLLSIKRLYKQGWLMSFGKWLLLGIIYLILFLVSVFIIITLKMVIFG